MPTRIAKGFSLCTAIIGVLCLSTGIGIAICAWVLNGSLPSGFYFKDKDRTTESITIGNYWWGGMIYVLPGILGIIAGCTRNVTAMVLYLIFNLICCVCSLVVVVMCGLVLLVWVAVDTMLQHGDCHNTLLNSCECSSGDTSFTLYGGSCTVFLNIQAIIGAMVSMAALSSVLSFIASYVSCCSLCNQESTDVGNVIITGGAGVYQPPPVVVNNTGPYPPQQMHPAGYAPPPYQQQQQYQQQPAYNPYHGAPGVYNNADGTNNGYPMPYANSDKSNLMK